MVFEIHWDHLKNHLDHFPGRVQKQVGFTLKSIKAEIYVSTKTSKTNQIDSKKPISATNQVVIYEEHQGNRLKNLISWQR